MRTQRIRGARSHASRGLGEVDWGRLAHLLLEPIEAFRVLLPWATLRPLIGELGPPGNVIVRARVAAGEVGDGYLTTILWRNSHTVSTFKSLYS